MKLIPIPNYNEYRLNLMFDAYKWDPQFLDNNTIAKYALVISKEEDEELKELTEKLDEETRKSEEVINNNLNLAKMLKLPRKIKQEIKLMKNYNPNTHIRLMRYDFHPTYEQKWTVSEVNSDVPGGFAEASIMPQIAIDALKKNKYYYKNFGDILTKAIIKKVPAKGRIMLVHCTSYSDDRQVMQFLGDKLETLGFDVIYGAADHLIFRNNEAISILDGNEGKINGIFRFTPTKTLARIF